MAGGVDTKDEMIGFLENDLGISCLNSAVAIDSALSRLSFLLKKKPEASVHNFYSSIHKAKGLEADCVLVVAKSLNELKKWIETEFEKRCEDKQDTCRIGFVGFSRAKQILCIACKQSIGDSVKDNLQNLGVSTLN